MNIPAPSDTPAAAATPAPAPAPAPAAPWRAFTREPDPSPGVAHVQLCGPGRGNLMGHDFWTELPRLMAALDADPQVRAVVLSGAGRHFSVGLDAAEVVGPWLPRFAAGAPDQAAARSELLAAIEAMQAAITSVARCRVPVVAAVHGWCIGGGVDLISAADVRLSSADAQFSVREVRLAIVADVGSLQRLRGIIGEGVLRELALTGSDITAARAHSIGLVNAVLADREALLAAAVAMAAQIAANAPLAVTGTKRLLNEDREADIARGLRQVAVWNAAYLPSADLVEALTAQQQGRPPTFRGC